MLRYSLGAALRKHNVKKSTLGEAGGGAKKNPSAGRGRSSATPMLASRRSWPTAAPAKKNFYIFYEIDGEEVCSVLRADEYGGDEDFSWVLLEPAEGA